MLRFGEAEGCPRASHSLAHLHRAAAGDSTTCPWDTRWFWDSPDTEGAPATMIPETPAAGVGHPTRTDLPACVYGFSDMWPFCEWGLELVTGFQ